MIVIEGTSKVAFGEGTLSELERTIYQKKQISPFEYRYDSVDTLLFELYMRTQIMESSRALSKSGVYFADFKHSMCNPAYWDITDQGRFQLKSGVAPQDAIRDIFTNGTSYAFECSMAVVVVLYKAILESIDPEKFDIMNSDLLLFDYDSNSNLHLINRTVHEEAVTGDVLYFLNPEFEPKIPWGKGENVILMENDLVYGHGYGFGIASKEVVIKVLNNHRIPGSTQSAYLTEQYVHPDFSYFALFQCRSRNKPIIAKVGEWIYVRKR
ncbi:protein-glutamine gamma-glutamyltransferase [Paenibacillus aceris]|uniref:Protein-glutamine gamma-glutamyltransferase n=1 Tax=Paenibacillus aceris TaxID=869555 RepID=A0ABS4HQP8_9BACL|nr:protein-glutamine gamma-glutamyltransferase [Paenibacillus aceris]MBP1960934.1 protein-glutamine gamma-glutamyltransferase [Paenibacillus aceris]NHW35396.1 protein-glutamine gamma-glutamyltransferase [Paenibacillus aceris]